MYIQSLTETNAAPYPVAAPTLTGGSHLSYAIQWSIFSICAIVGWVLVVRKALAKKRTA
jgi:cytochrome oxidase assembly protein ShyY1